MGKPKNLTDKQKEAMGLAIKHGYYEYPRKIDVQDLARESKLSFSTFHAHLRKWLVNNNEIVEKGQPIGIIGQSGRSRGIHNHWEVYFGDKRINPRNIKIYF